MDEDEREMRRYTAPRTYWKLDVFLNAEDIAFSPSDAELGIDHDGDYFTCHAMRPVSRSENGLTPSQAVAVLVEEGTAPEDVARTLRKIADEVDGGLLPSDPPNLRRLN